MLGYFRASASKSVWIRIHNTAGAGSFNKIILPKDILLLLKKPDKNRPQSKRHRTGQLLAMRTAGEEDGFGFSCLRRL
jgi:hypothetical protein